MNDPKLVPMSSVKIKFSVGCDEDGDSDNFFCSQMDIFI